MDLTAIETEGAREAFETLKPRIDAQEELRDIRVDVQRVSIFAASVGRTVRQPEMRARFASLPAQEFDITHVDILESAALAAWHASVERQSALARSSDAMLPAEVVDKGRTLKQRLLKLTSYYLEDDPVERAELDSIRQGHSYVDLASDLFRLATVSERHQHLLAGDTKHYRPGDVQDAKRIGHQILEILGDGNDGDAQHWADATRRAWSFLVTVYEEVSAAARWLYRHEPDTVAQFPSLYAVGRTSARSRSSRPAAVATAAEPALDQPTA